MFIFILIILLDRVIWSPSHLNCDQLECSIGLNSLSSQEERKVVNHTVSILASHEFNQLRCLFTERQSVNLLNLVAFLDLRARGHLSLLDLDQMKLLEMLGATDTDLLFARLGYFGRIFLDQFSFDQHKEA